MITRDDALKQVETHDRHMQKYLMGIFDKITDKNPELEKRKESDKEYFIRMNGLTKHERDYLKNEDLVVARHRKTLMDYDEFDIQLWARMVDPNELKVLAMRIGQGARKVMYCEPPIYAQNDWYADFEFNEDTGFCRAAKEVDVLIIGNVGSIDDSFEVNYLTHIMRRGRATIIGTELNQGQITQRFGHYMNMWTNVQYF